MHRSYLFLHTFCMQEGVQSLYIFFQNHNYPEGTGNFIYKASILAGQQKALLKYDSLIVQPHKCCIPPELPSLQIAIYFAQTTQPFIIAIASQLASYIVPPELPPSQQLYILLKLPSLSFHYSYSQLHSQLASQSYCTTRITFFLNSYIFCSNYPVILFYIASQLAIHILI